ncbi:MAG: NAD(P)/FAD-dependent oxidoreductase [Chlorobi bacterium]|nr:NAD(P)/FAD-dependent oxidoreductase [Chlorobiota bacterium]
MDAEVTIIGAGVIGLAVAARLSRDISPVIVVEKHKKFGQETSSRNSEVIHSGIYYPKMSLKARLCLEGKKWLYQYCEQHDIPYRKCGKLIVACDESQVPQIQKIVQQATINGVTDARLIHHDELHELEPHVSGDFAAWFPTTGIIDSHAFMQSLERESISQGVEFAYAHEVTGIRPLRGGYEITVVQADDTPFSFTTAKVINASGLNAGKTAALAGISDKTYRQYFWKGEYFTLIHGKHKMISRLVYQAPEPDTTGLGIHTTPDTYGRMRLGPNAIYLESSIPEFSVDPSHAASFHESVRRFLPFIEPEDLTPDQAGVRPKLQKPGDPWKDFIIREERERGNPGFVNLLGIESPGLTASLSMANYIYRLLYKTNL